MLVEKDREIERLKHETEEQQEKIIKKDEGENDIIVILSTDLLSEMFSASRQQGEGGQRTEEVNYLYLKVEDGIVTGYETDSARSNNNNTQINFNK
jgi:hypothetical protein